MENGQLTDIQRFKKILEYFVLHMSYICGKKKAELSDELKKRYQTATADIGKFCYKEKKIEKPNDENWKESGKGYKGDLIQNQLTTFIGIGENVFSVLNKWQKICISVDSTSGYKGGSYLHWVDIKDGNDQNITQYTNGTNINPVFEITQSEAKEDTVTFIGLEVGPSQNSPTFVFAPMYFSFDELGLFNDAPNKNQKYNLHAFFEYYQEMRRNEIKGALTYKGEKQLLATKNMILTGAPGTGKTWSAKNIAAWMIKGKPFDSNMQEDDDFKNQCKFVQFHPSYDYTDFVEGLRPIDTSDNNNNATSQSNNNANASNSIGFKRVDGIFKEFCKNALREVQIPPVYKKPIQKKYIPQKGKYIFIIDEINRGEMSKILGELFYSIDPGYRGENGKVNTQYQNMITDKDDPFKDGFFVPENVYIIGTMNDIDRSVESMDFAMRRRFSFLEVKANEREDMWSEGWTDLAKACMEAINEKIDEIPGLSSAYHIGPAYFKKLNDYELKDGNVVYGYDFFKLWDNHLKGVLFEYLRGKNNAESTIDEIFDKYVRCLITAVNSRFNKGGVIGKLCFNSKGQNVSDAARAYFGYNPNETQKMLDYLTACKVDAFNDNFIKKIEEELRTRPKKQDDESQTVENDNNNKKKAAEAKLKNEAKARAIDKAKIMIERAMKLGKEIEINC